MPPLRGEVFNFYSPKRATLVFVSAIRLNRCCLSNSVFGGGRCTTVASIRLAGRFDQKDLGLVCGAGAVDLAFGDNHQLAGTEGDAVRSLIVHGDFAGDDEKEIVGGVMFVKREFALKFDHHHVVAVVSSHDLGVPMGFKERKFLF